MGARRKQRKASELDTEEASAIAAYVIEAVKRHDPYCGGATS